VLILAPPRRPAGAAPAPAPPAAASLGTGGHLWLVRHARVAREFRPIAYGSQDVPLSDTGRAQTRRMGAAFRGLDVVAVVSSDLARARAMGAAIAGATGAPLRETPALREIDRGHWQGLSREEFQTRWTAAAEEYWRDPYRWHVPGGDSDETLAGRAWPEVERAVRAAAGGTVVITAHNNLMRVVVARALGVETPESYRFATDPARATLLIDRPRGWELGALNVERPDAD